MHKRLRGARTIISPQQDNHEISVCSDAQGALGTEPTARDEEYPAEDELGGETVLAAVELQQGLVDQDVQSTPRVGGDVSSLRQPAVVGRQPWGWKEPEKETERSGCDRVSNRKTEGRGIVLQVHRVRGP